MDFARVNVRGCISCGIGALVLSKLRGVAGVGVEGRVVAGEATTGVAVGAGALEVGALSSIAWNAAISSGWFHIN